MNGKKKNPCLPAGVLLHRNAGVWTTPFDTPADRRAQMLERRYRLTPRMAREVARLHFGEVGHE